MPWYWSWPLVLGVLASLGGVFASRLHAGSPSSRPALPILAIVSGALLAVVACFICLPARFPFSAGQQMAYGILIGLGAALLSLILFLLSRPSDSYASEVGAVAAAAGPAIIAIAAIEMFFQGAPSYALFGCLAGNLLAFLPLLWVAPEGAAPLWFHSLALLALGLGSLLGIERFNSHATRPFWALPTIAFAVTLLGAVVGALALGGIRFARWLVAASAIALGLAGWWGINLLLQRSYQLTVPLELPYLLIIGWIAFTLVAAFSSRADESLFSSAAVPITGLVAVIIAFNIYGGSGVALALAAGLPLSLAFWRRSKQGAAWLWLAAFGALFLAYRLFLAKYAGEVRGDIRLEFGRHYVLFGLAAALIWMSAAGKARSGFGSVSLQLLALAFAPPIFFFVFGYEALLGLILGLLLWQLALPNLSSASYLPAGLPASFPALVTIWALVIPRWADFILGQTRLVRGLAAGGAVALALLLLALVSLRRPASIPEPTPEKS